MSRPSALDFIGTRAAALPLYVAAVQFLRANLVPGCEGQYTRPASKLSGGLRASGGCPIVLPPHERLVAVESDKAAHAEAAARLQFPPKGTAETADTDLRAAVAYAVVHRDTLRLFRKGPARKG